MSQARFLEEAEGEFLSEVRYYANVQENGAEKFRAAVEEATARALAFPMAGLKYIYAPRRVFLKGYPFFLVYRPEESGVAIFAVVHEQRRPGYWGKRVR